MSTIDIVLIVRHQIKTKFFLEHTCRQDVVRREFGWASRQYVVSVFSVLHTAHEHQLIRVQMYNDDLSVFILLLGFFLQGGEGGGGLEDA